MDAISQVIYTTPPPPHHHHLHLPSCCFVGVTEIRFHRTEVPILTGNVVPWHDNIFDLLPEKVPDISDIFQCDTFLFDFRKGMSIIPCNHFYIGVIKESLPRIIVSDYSHYVLASFDKKPLFLLLSQFVLWLHAIQQALH